MWVHISYTADNGTWLTGIARGLPVERIEIDSHAPAHLKTRSFPNSLAASCRSEPWPYRLFQICILVGIRRRAATEKA
jgi:hypothetical protein